MTQDERWMERYNEVMTFVTTNKRRPSKYTPKNGIVGTGGGILINNMGLVS